MTDPHTIIPGALKGAGLSSVSLFIGAQFDAFIIGLISAVFVSIWLETIDNRKKAAAAFFFASLLAGYGSPLAAEWVSGHVPSIASNMEALRLFLAVIIGGGAPTFVPMAIKYGSNKVNGGQQ